MAFGFKLKKVKFDRGYTLEELYDEIKDKEFSAGQPEMTKQGLGYLIAFPALDSQNQVQIFPASMKKQSEVYQVLKGQEAGISNMLGNDLKNKLTDGLFGMKSIMGKNAKEGERLVEVTAKELEVLGL